jgi:hypothetical protein
MLEIPAIARPTLTHLRNVAVRTGIIRTKSKNVVQEAGRLAREHSTEAALAFLKRYAADDQKRASFLILANAAQSDAEWQLHMDAFLARWDLSPVTFRPGAEKRFFRLQSAPLKTIQDERRVSIIMPAFNCQCTVGHAAESILNQTWRNLELIIVDDASSDDTWSVLQKLAARDERVRILRNSVNVGPYVSKNRALPLVSGTYITIHDADDWALPERIERQVQDIVENSAKATIGHLLRVNEDLQCHQLGHTSIKSHDGVSRLAYMSCLFETKSFREALGNWDSVRFGADSELLARARLAYGQAFHTTPRITMFALDIGGNLTRDPIHGLYVNGRTSATRQEYKTCWQEWHATLATDRTYLEFPQSTRPFPVPAPMRVDPSAVENLLVGS